jgi:hypothetical protein
MNIKVEKGTTRESEPLCYSCRHYKHRRSAMTGKEWHECSADCDGPNIRLSEPMAECNSYFPQTHYISMDELLPQAYILTRNRAGEVDFIPSMDILNSETAKDRRLKRELESIRYKNAPGFRRDY